MKELIFFFLIIATGSASASCLVHIKKTKYGAEVSVWRHIENVDDTVEVHNVKNLGSATDLFHVEQGSVDIVFKNNQCLSMRYYDTKTSRVVKWSDLSQLEQSCINDIAKRFKIHERQGSLTTSI